MLEGLEFNHGSNTSKPLITIEKLIALRLVAAGAALCVVLLLWVELWPFQQKPVVQNLEEASDSAVHGRARPTGVRGQGFVARGGEAEQLGGGHCEETETPIFQVRQTLNRAIPEQFLFAGHCPVVEALLHLEQAVGVMAGDANECCFEK